LSLTFFIAGCETSNIYTAPDITGMSYNEAVERYGNDYQITVQEEYHKQYPIGTVIKQNPEKGAAIKKRLRLRLL